MKGISCSLFSFICLLLLSCGDDIISIQRWVEGYHQEKWGLSTSQAILYCKLNPTQTAHTYEGTLSICENSVIWDIPLTVKKEGKDYKISYILSPSEDINQLRREYVNKVELSY